MFIMAIFNFNVSGNLNATATAEDYSLITCAQTVCHDAIVIAIFLYIHAFMTYTQYLICTYFCIAISVKSA